MRRALVALLALVLIVLAGSRPTAAQDRQEPPPQRTVRVAVSPIEPLVIKRGDTFGGFMVEVWDDIAKRNNYRTVYVEKGSIEEQLDAVRTGEADVAIGDLTITADRAKSVGFTEPTLNAGLQIMTRETQSSTLDLLWDALTDPAVLLLLGIMAVTVVVAAVVIWLLERRSNPDFAHNARKGVGEGTWWATVTMLTVGYGDRVPRTMLGRAFSILWMLFGMLLVATVTATFTANLTVNRFAATITKPDDLRDHSVVTVRDSEAAAYLRAHRIDATLVDDPQQMIDQVRGGSTDAAVYAAPVLARAVHESDGNLVLPASPFTHSYDAFAVSHQSGLQSEVNDALLTMFDDGQYDHLYRAWFSS
jgi:polar amino acid transport system substrate-binding protein